MSKFSENICSTALELVSLLLLEKLMEDQAQAVTKTLSFLSVRSDAGSGRAFAVLYERGPYSELAAAVAAELQGKTRTILVESERIDASTFDKGEQELEALFTAVGMRQASFVAFGSPAALVQQLTLRQPKTVRTLVLVDAETRPHPTVAQRIIDRIEQALPLGLPLRFGESSFDVKPFLQRIRCPVLVVTSTRATPYLRSEAEALENGLSTAWRYELSAESGGEAAALAALVLEFQDVPAKCPQGSLVRG